MTRFKAAVMLSFLKISIDFLFTLIIEPIAQYLTQSELALFPCRRILKLILQVANF